MSGQEDCNKMFRYLVVGGRPFIPYTKTMTYTGLNVVGKSNSLGRAKALWRKKYEACGGLLLIVDTTTGLEVSAG
jgi:hypothetical protein